MKSYFVYILECSDKSYYTGVTNDLERRFFEHKKWLMESSYTHHKRPVKLVYFEESNHINDAIVREKQIKWWSRNKKIALIKWHIKNLICFSKSGR